MEKKKLTVEDLMCAMPRFGLFEIDIDGSEYRFDTEGININFYTNKLDAIDGRNKLCLSFDSVFLRNDLMELKVVDFWPGNYELNIIVDGVWNNYLITEEIKHAGRK